MRREFTKSVRLEAYKRSGGVCECHRLLDGPPNGCGQKVSRGNIFFEHIIPDNLGGKATLDNCAVLTKTCWRRKTDEYDQPIVAKARRQFEKDIGARPKRKWAKGRGFQRWEPRT